MVRVVSLFIGLIFGAQNVQVAVDERVEWVEIHLDGKEVCGMEAPRWLASCDFGDVIRPHRLEAIAFDARGRELGRDTRWLNVSLDLAVANLLLLEDDGGDPYVRLQWETVVRNRPRSLAVTFDGKPLSFDDPQRISLPRHDPSRVHILRAELDFGSAVTTSTEMVFGAAEISTEMTLVPVRLKGKSKKPPEPSEVAGLFSAGGRPLAALAFERGPAEVFIVIDRSHAEGFTHASREIPVARKKFFKLPADQRVRFLFPVSETVEGVRRRFNLFDVTEELGSRDGNLVDLIDTIRLREGDQRLADAVAVAGLSASGGRHRRAVVLILGHAPEDHSRFAAAQVRRYLDELRVPLYVWRSSTEPSAVADAWGDSVIDISSITKLSNAVLDLNRDVARQWIAWVDGRHLPREVELSSDARSIELVGSAVP